MAGERITGEPDDRDEQGCLDPFADFKRLDARVRRFVDHAAELRLRKRAIRRVTITAVLIAVSLAGLACAAFVYFTSGQPIGKSEAARVQLGLVTAIVCGFIAAVSYGKTAGAWRDYRRAQSGRKPPP
jgi:hypothetical protein